MKLLRIVAVWPALDGEQSTAAKIPVRELAPVAAHTKGKAVAGFGRDGVVYLVAGDARSGFHLERTQIQ